MNIDDFERTWKNPLGSDQHGRSDQHQQIEGAKKEGARYAITLPLPRSFTLYVQQDATHRLLDLVESLQPPADVQMVVEPSSDQTQRWDELGYVLGNAGLFPGQPVYNPQNLPFRYVWPDEVPKINLLELLAEVVARRLKLSEGAVVSQMLYKDSEGARLVLFSKEA